VITGIENNAPALFCKVPKGSTKEVAFVKSCKLELPAMPLKFPPKEKEIESPFDDRLALVINAPFAP
jgi:hypothetical protein